MCQCVGIMRVLEIMASTAALVGAVSVLVAARESSAATDSTGCVEVIERRAGQSCGSPDSYEIAVRNRCEQAIDAKLCLEKPDHTWACEIASGVKSGATTGIQACASTRETWLWARRANGTEPAPEPSR